MSQEPPAYFPGKGHERLIVEMHFCAITKKLPNELRSECKEEESYRATLAVALGTFGGVEQLST